MTVYCTCGHPWSEHGPVGCNGFHMSGGANGMRQRCGCHRTQGGEEEQWPHDTPQ